MRVTSASPRWPNSSLAAPIIGRKRCDQGFYNITKYSTYEPGLPR
jgi:hypothetical protein